GRQAALPQALVTLKLAFGVGRNELPALACEVLVRLRKRTIFRLVAGEGSGRIVEVARQFAGEDISPCQGEAGPLPRYEGRRMRRVAGQGDASLRPCRHADLADRVAIGVIGAIELLEQAWNMPAILPEMRPEPPTLEVDVAFGRRGHFIGRHGQ